eukprot:scpid51509/ scgid1789/ GC-rich sequence DNA-binding factor 1
MQYCGLYEFVAFSVRRWEYLGNTRPSMFKKRDKKANLRRTQDDDEDKAGGAADDDNGEVGLAIQTPMSTQKKKRKGPASAEKKSTVLSFGDEEEDGEGDSFQIKRSAHSRKAIQQFKSKGKRQQPDSNTNTQLSAKGLYTKEALDELRAAQAQSSQPSSNGSPRVAETSAVPTQDEPTEEERHAEALKYAVDSALKSTEQGGAVPSAELIHLARKKRERARQTAEFLPLDDTVRAGSNGKQSRMVRDDDNDRSDGDDGFEHLNFSDVSRKAAQRQHRTEMEAAITGYSNQDAAVSKTAGEEAMHDDNDDDDDGDAAIRRWEEQQMSSAASARSLGTAARVLEMQNRMEGLDSNAYGPSRYGAAARASGTSAGRFGTVPATPVAAHSPLPAQSVSSVKQLPPILSSVTSSSVLSTLMAKQSALSEITTSHEGQMSRTTEELHLSEKAAESLERQLADTSDKYNFFQESDGYVADLLTSLDEKVNTLSLLEDRFNRTWQELSKYLLDRRKQDLADEAKENDQNGKMFVMEPAHRQRVAERDARRNRRRQHRKSSGMLTHDDGLSSDDELTEMEKVKCSTEKESIGVEAQKLFEDVPDQFCDVSLIGQRFEMWKLAYRSTYDEAYTPLCLSKLFAPFVRLETLLWNPLEAGQASVEDMAWFKKLMLYSAGGDGQSQPDIEDDDTFLIPNLVEKVIITKLREFVRHGWDPLSSSQTANLVAIVKKLLLSYPSVHAASRHTEELVQSICDRLKMSVDVDPYIPLYSKNVMESQQSAPVMFFHRQYWSCFKLLLNVLQWHGILSSGKLQQ